jgi:hypothetical protein
MSMSITKTVERSSLADGVSLAMVLARLAAEAREEDVIPDAIIIPDVWLYIEGSRDGYTFYGFPKTKHLYIVLCSNPTTIYRVD